MRTFPTDAEAAGPFVGRLRWPGLGQDGARRVVAAALDVLSRDGVRVTSRRALDLLAGAGAAVDRAAHTARLPERLVRDAVEQAPRRFVLGARDARHDLALDAVTGHAGAGGPAPLVRDGETGAVRPVTAADRAAALRLADALPEIAFVTAGGRGAGEGGAAALPRPAVADLAACFVHAAKHVQVRGLRSVEEAGEAVAMARAVAGPGHDLRPRPPLSFAGGALEAESLEATLLFAAEGLPCGFRVATGTPPSSPDDGSAWLARVTAEALGACVLAQAVGGGVPFVFSALGALPGRDPGSPADLARDAGLASALGEVAAAAGLPLQAPDLRTDAAGLDWRSAVDAVTAALAAALARGGLLAGAGLVADGSTWSQEQLVLDAEILAVVRSIAAGIAVDDETIALDVIEKVGIGGNYLAERHTRAHMKDVWRPRVFDRASHEQWLTRGRPGSAEMARDAAAAVLAEHEVPPLEAEKAATLQRIVERAGL